MPGTTSLFLVLRGTDSTETGTSAAWETAMHCWVGNGSIVRFGMVSSIPPSYSRL